MASNMQHRHLLIALAKESAFEQVIGQTNYCRGRISATNAIDNCGTGLWVIAPVQATDCDSYLFCHRVTDMSFRNNSISRALRWRGIFCIAENMPRRSLR